MLVDLTAIWTAPSGRWTVGLYGRNLTDEAYRIGGYDFNGPAVDDSVVAFYGAPRTVSVSLQYRF